MKVPACLLVLSWIACSQSNTTSGSCSPIPVSNSGTITINCFGLTKEKVTELLKIMNKILAGQGDLKVLGDKIDQILVGVHGIVEAQAPRRFTEEQKRSIIAVLAHFKGQRIGTVVSANSRLNKEYLDEVRSLLVAAGWEVFQRGVTISGVEPIGVVVTVPEEDLGMPVISALIDIFQQNGADFRLEYQPKAADESKYRSLVKRGEIMIHVGDKR